MRARWFPTTRPGVLVALLVLLLPVVVGACSGGGSGPATITGQSTSTSAAESPTADVLPAGATVMLGSSAFAQTTVTLSAGQSLRFVDPSTTGGTHVICLGMTGQCDASAQGPDSLLAPGLSLHPGDTKVIAFPHAGTYDVTCTVHPSMQLTISVLGVG
jgi:plastocyanin